MELIRHKIDGVEIDEPIGFDNFKTNIERGEYHGISAEVSVGELRFYGKAAEMIREAHDIDIDIELVYAIEQKCGAGDWTEVYRGVVDLSTYKEMTGDYCTVSCYVGEVGAKTTFNTRSQTTVSLNSRTTMDGESLPVFPEVNVELPSKAIRYTARGVLNQDSNSLTMNFGEDRNVDAVIPFGTQEIAELNTFIERTSLIRFEYGVGYENYLFFKNTNSEFANTNYRVRGRIIATVYPHAINEATLQLLNGSRLIFDKTFSATSDNTIQIDESFDFVESIGYNGGMYGIIGGYSAGGYGYLTATIKTGTWIEISIESATQPSSHTLSLVGDALSRVSDVISGLPVKSDWYSVLGGGGLKALVNGWELRKADLPVGVGYRPGIQLSFRDLFESLTAIDNIGWGFWEEDGQLYVRVERWSWFYKNHVVFSIDNPNKKTRKTDTRRIFSRLKTGYSKSLDQQEINAIDAFHTEREFSTGVKAVDTAKEAVCKFIADPYAIEVTRRKQFEQTTENWKHDDDVFVIVLKHRHGVIIRDIFTVDTGISGGDSSIISPETLYNARISPKRNAIRWAERFFEVNSLQDELKFMSGTGNVEARGVVPPNYGDYTFLEDSAENRLVSENTHIPKKQPVLKPEILEFTYPLTAVEYNLIKNDPYGIIQVDGEDCYLSELEYNFNTSEANFKLIPKHE